MNDLSVLQCINNEPYHGGHYFDSFREVSKSEAGVVSLYPPFGG